jgi:hypothetical protein
MNPAWLDHAAKAFGRQTQMESDLAYYEENSVAGRLRPGTARSSDIWRPGAGRKRRRLSRFGINPGAGTLAAFASEASCSGQ